MTFPFVSGLITAGFLISGLFFVSFWVKSRDILFLTFAAAFALLATAQALLVLGGIDREDQSWLYLLRLAAFGLIIFGIVMKNRAR